MVSLGEFLAILGPSESSKLTLLSVLEGRLHGRHGGVVLANGKEMTKLVVRRTGFVTQHDVLYPHLTVRETLVFYAILRLLLAMVRAEKVHAAKVVIAKLGLDKCIDTMIGNAFMRGVLCCGERKRIPLCPVGRSATVRLEGAEVVEKEVGVECSVRDQDEPVAMAAPRLGGMEIFSSWRRPE
ncbi:hypothetical protein J5N97_014383 [Dioscorea zingiberensis]|uniref:ABC transporter domain-containing protein n=1 Tax=Dioscorea zingiberensis TaxID=325984 RepID=A0A9D5CTV7_9LILI|nr:hypothetical protein J5N97_014383 [Dioscorea zingiberensis]